MVKPEEEEDVPSMPPGARWGVVVAAEVAGLPMPSGPTTIGDNASQGSSVALRGGRKRGAASDALGSALDGGAWQLHASQQRVVGRGERSRLQTSFFEAGAAPSPSALHAEARAKARAARRTQAA